MIVQAVLILLAALVASAAGEPNFVFIQGEGQGWNSTSVRMDPEVPESRNDYFQRRISNVWPRAEYASQTSTHHRQGALHRAPPTSRARAQRSWG